MGIKLSHTAKEKYLNCPLSYYLYYNLGYREKFTGSSLPFGIAVDEGLNFLLHNPDKLEEAKIKYATKFHNAFNDLKQNKQIVSFSKADLDETLTDKTDDEGAQDSLYQKGLLFLEAYKEQILPEFKKIKEVQKFFSIENSVGDQIIGFVDLLVELKDGRLVLLDNKTSGSPYNETFSQIDVDKRKQLATYKEALGSKYPIDDLGFVTMIKAIRKKKEPRVRTQLILGNVDDEFTDSVFQEYEEVLSGIRMGQFPSNSPKCNSFYGKCICEKYVQSNGENKSSLIQLKRKGYE